jgi:UDPglucose 6-dehydrogenase/GDP-mannose 6-dehydrogenase
MNITVLGLAFKPGTDDMRQSPSIPIINKIIDLGAIVSAYDPIAEAQARKVFESKNVNYSNSLKDSIKNSEVVVLLTSWPEFESLPLLIKSLQKKPLIIDGRGMLSMTNIDRYECLGN